VYSPLKSLLGTENLSLNGGSGESGNGSKTMESGASKTSSITSSGNDSLDNRGGNLMGSISDMLDRLGNTDRDLLHSVDGSVDGGGDLLDGVGAGLMNDGLADGLVGADRSGDHLASEGGDVLEDGLSDMGGLDNGGGLVSGDGGRDVSVGSLSHGVGQGGDLGDDLSESMSLSGGVGKVSSQPVVLNGSRVMSWGTDKVGGCVTHNSSSWGHSHGASTGKSNKRGEKQEGVHGGSC